MSPGPQYGGDSQEDDGRGKEFGIETPVGKLHLRGYHIGNVLQLLASALLALMGYMLYEVRTDTKAAAVELSKATREAASTISISAKSEHAALQVSIDRSSEVQAEANYILTLSPKEREALNLRMPDSLRNKIYGKDLRDRYSR